MHTFLVSKYDLITVYAVVLPINMIYSKADKNLERTENMENSKRRVEITFLNVLLCLLVIFIHVSSSPVSNLNKDSLQYLIVMVPWRLSAFVVQGFIFLSGLKLFLKGCDNFNYGVFIKKRLKTILLPYALWVMIYYVYFCAIGYFPFSLKDYIMYLLDGSIVSPFYFIIAITQYYILMPLWILLVKKIHPAILIIGSMVIMVLAKAYLPSILGQSFRYYDRIFTTYLFYWIFGCCAGLHYEKFKTAIKRLFPLATLLFITAAAFDACLSYGSFAKGMYFPYLENLHVLYCVFAILFLYGLFLRLSKLNVPFMKLIKGIDVSSYYIYLSHCFVMNIADHTMAILGIGSIGAAYLMRIISVYSITLSLCILYSTIKSRRKKIC